MRKAAGGWPTLSQQDHRGAPSLSRSLRQGGAFDFMLPESARSKSPPCLAKMRRDKDGATPGFLSMLGLWWLAPVGGRRDFRLFIFIGLDVVTLLSPSGCDDI